MDVREMVARSAITGSVAAVTFLTIDGLRKAFMAEARTARASKVAYQDGRYLVAVRGPGEWHDVREFVQPHNRQVQAVYQEIGADWWELYRWVNESTAYRLDTGEFWLFPSETISRGEGDCEDSSILLTSLLRAAGYNAAVAVGHYRGYGHAWVELNSGGQILETTLTEPIVVDDPENYHPHFYFTDQEALELWPGALKEVFTLKRSEFAKMRLIGSR